MISFYSQVKNRYSQLEQTIHYNLEQISKNKNTEWVIVDAGSNDGCVGLIKDNLLGKERTSFYQALDFYDYSQPIFKNFAARLTSGDYIFNLDIDNFIDMKSIKDLSKGTICSTQERRGCHGRIGCSREIFQKVGGYNESLHPAGCQDLDLISRCQMIGYEFIEHIPSIMPIQNTKEETIKNINNPYGLTWDQINELNKEIMNKNIREKNFCPNKKFSPCKFLYNSTFIKELTESF
jgi:hypothetical protein